MLDFYKPTLPVQEAIILDTIKRLGKIKAGRTAVHIHLSKLSPSNRKDHYLRIASELFISCVSSIEGQLFSFENGDLFFITKNTSLNVVDNAVNRLRVLFSEDPLSAFENEDNHFCFCTWYNFETDYKKLLEDIETLLKQAEHARLNPESNYWIDKRNISIKLQPEMMGKLEQSLECADLTNVMRRQTICAVIEGMPPEPLFDEIFVSIEDLQSITMPGVNFASDRWLFQYLTCVLDQRVLYTLSRNGITTTRPFSVNLNISSILSPSFARFESSLPPQLRGRMVIEMNKIDVFSDMGAFLFARDYLHDRGFRMCLDGLTHLTLPYYDRARLGFDLIKIFWTPGSIDEMRQDMIPNIRSIVMKAGQARTILCRCDSKRSLEIGQSLGIVMFQGRYVEYLLNQSTIS